MEILAGCEGLSGLPLHACADSALPISLNMHTWNMSKPSQCMLLTTSSGVSVVTKVKYQKVRVSHLETQITNSETFCPWESRVRSLWPNCKYPVFFFFFNQSLTYYTRGLFSYFLTTLLLRKLTVRRAALKGHVICTGNQPGGLDGDLNTHMKQVGKQWANTQGRQKMLFPSLTSHVSLETFYF